MLDSHENLESAEDRVRLVNQAAERGDIDYLVGALRDPEEDAQIAAALALGRMTSTDGRKLWRQARSNDPSWWRRAFDR